MKCPNCKNENPEKGKFCIECGIALSKEVACATCGTVSPMGSKFCQGCGTPLAPPSPPPQPATPTSFAQGRYQVRKFLGEGGKKKVYLAHDTVLDRDVAFALIKTEHLDDAARTRITREAQAMGRLGDHPNIVSIYDMGEHNGQPYIVLPLLPGGDVEGLIEKAPDHRLPIDRALDIAKAVCRGLDHAHRKNIIHRDIKPGNVWLSADGTAKIGDFGLALATERSRLTHSGMMVGTFYYMPPEQAMGSEVTARADLYSLGAMLYEMATGRPPFTGDDKVAIIGQHINTPPVSPSWHRPDLPARLSALIMQLLEKDPKKRPASAADVLADLETIESSKVSSHGAAATVENPLYRRVFVGREAELRQLQSAFDNSVSGQGSLMMVVGEPGIGKTSLTEQLATYVSLRGGQTLVGHCYEEGSLSLPYLPFVEALRSYTAGRDLEDLKKELGTNAPDVARIVSEVRQRLHIEPLSGQGQDDKYRLLQGVTDFLGNAAQSQPLVLVLEDLHSADGGTLEMLGHLARFLSGKRLLIIGTYRDVQVDRAHPLSSALAELRRLPIFTRVLLRGLNPDEVRRMLSSIARQDVPWSLAEAVHRQTEGNPLFVQEVLRYLSEEGILARHDGKWLPSKDTPVEMRIPDGLKDVIGKRLTSLSENCNKLLSQASVIGRDFRLDVLQKVAGLSDDDTFSALDEAKKAAIVEERDGVGGTVTYRFAHAFFRQTLYEEIIAPRRIRLHQQVARALEAVYSTRLDEHATELAEHYAHSSDPSDLRKAVSYGERAATRATSVYAYSEAARLLEQAIKVQEILDPEDNGKRCDLLLALAEALIQVGAARQALDVAVSEAFSIAETIGDATRASLACQNATMGLLYWANVSMERLGTPEAAQWVERADRHAPAGTVARLWADIAKGTLKCANGLFMGQWMDMREGVGLCHSALEAARSIGELLAFDWAGTMWLTYAKAPQHFEERLHLVEELATTLSAPAVRGLSAGAILAADVYLEAGMRDRAEECFRELKIKASQTGQASLIVQAMIGDSLLATLDGRLDEAVEMSDRIRERGKDVGMPGFSAVVAGLCGVTPRLLLGRAEEAYTVAAAHKEALFAHLGRLDEERESLNKWVVNRPGIGSADDETGATKDVALLEAAVLVGHHEAVELLLNRLACAAGRAVAINRQTCIGRHLGAAAAFLGRPDEARSYYAQAMEVAQKLRFRPEIALIRLQLAELLFEHYPAERATAMEHLDFAIGEFREMKMQPSLERALRHKEILKA